VVAEKTKESIEGKYAVQHYSYLFFSLSLSLNFLYQRSEEIKIKNFLFFFFFLIEMMERDQYNFPLERNH
jgi:hypothetical protein